MRSGTKALIILFIVFLVLFGCSDCSKSESDDLLSIKVTDVNGKPMSGLDVKVYNRLSNLDCGYQGRPYTTISYSVNMESHVSLIIYNLQNDPIRILIDENMEAGYYQAAWDGKNENGEKANIGGTNVFWYEAIYSDIESREIIFQDSKYMCMHLLSEEASSIGRTDENGKFKFDNKLAFPNLFNLDSLSAIDEDGNLLCKFSISDTVKISLNGYSCNRRITSLSHNHFDIIWDPSDDDDDKRIIERGEISHPYFQAKNAGKDDPPPPPVTLASFDYSVTAENFVSINWETLSETNALGFNVYRSVEQSIPENSLNYVMIPATGTSSQSAVYNLLDTDAQPETTYYYWLEALDNDIASFVFGPITVYFENEIPPPLPSLQNKLFQNYPNPFN
ncbi:MAG: hypothetical protein PHR06_12310 [Candidatus Cloacimonetes bacterium]|nr:hypothetical protein [Candidatus Cloacimonadota bacterium]